MLYSKRRKNLGGRRKRSNRNNMRGGLGRSPKEDTITTAMDALTIIKRVLSKVYPIHYAAARAYVYNHQNHIELELLSNSYANAAQQELLSKSNAAPQQELLSKSNAAPQQELLNAQQEQQKKESELLEKRAKVQEEAEAFRKRLAEMEQRKGAAAH
jgi:hypothetical protein